MARVYFQEGKSITDEDATVFHEPVFYLVSEEVQSEEGQEATFQPKYEINEDKQQLILRVRVHSNFEDVHAALRSKLTSRAKRTLMNPGFEFVGIPYNIQTLNPDRAIFTSSQGIYTTGEYNFPKSDLSGMLVSQDINYVGFTEGGDIPIYFRHDNIEELEAFVRDLTSGADTLVFRYTFEGVEDLPCEASIDSRRVETSGLLKGVVGEGGEGYVNRDQAIDMARDIAGSDAIEVRCHNLQAADDLVDALLSLLGKPQPVAVSGDWPELLKLTEFDPNSITADIEAVIKEIDNSVVQDYWANAHSTASSNSAAMAAAAGITIGIPEVIGFQLSGSYSKAEAAAHGRAHKAVSDSLKKKGIYVEYDEATRRYIPKSVDLHTAAQMRTGWGTTRSIRYEVTSGGYGGEAFTLTTSAWTVVKDHREWTDLNNNLEAVKAEVFSEIERLQNELRTDYEVKIQSVLQFGVAGSTIAKHDDKNIAVLARGEGARIMLEAENDVELTGGDDIKIDATDDVVVSANDDVDVSARDDVTIWAKDDINIIAKSGEVKIKPAPMYAESCFYRLKRREAKGHRRYEYDTGRTDKIAIMAQWMSEDACTEAGIRVGLWRRGGDSQKKDNWHITIGNWVHCNEIAVRVVFMGGSESGREDGAWSWWYDKSASLRKLDNWCSE